MPNIQPWQAAAGPYANEKGEVMGLTTFAASKVQAPGGGIEFRGAGHHPE